MILILTHKDYSSEKVCDWLEYLESDYQIVNPNLVFDNVNFSISNNDSNDIFRIGEKSYKYSDVNVIWNRRWNYGNFQRLDRKYYTEKLYNILTSNNINDIRNFNNFFWKQFINATWIDTFQSENISKLDQLEIAKDVGLNIPETLITNTKKDLIAFYKQNNEKIITKSVSDCLNFFDKNNDLYIPYTSTIKDEDIKNLPESFGLSMFQKMIPKLLELRIFCLFDELYPMAIFSQDDEQTATDFRKYNEEIPNRTVPYLLPKEIKEKILKFLKKAQINSGSIDMIVTQDYEYVFLEINPVGQFGMTSAPCNYNLEKRIAETLIRIDNEKNDRK